MTNTFHETLSILDSSKISDYMCCPRRFMFRHVFGWSSNSFHLKFGERFHLAIEHCLIYGFDEENILKAMALFAEDWPDDYESSDKPKNLVSAYQALQQYGKKYAEEELTTIQTEIGGLVPISKTRKLAFKIDALVKDKNGFFWALEHKTGSRNNIIWETQWFNRYQLHCYLHALNMAFPVEKVRGVIVNGIFFLKKSQDFNRIKIVHSNEMQLLYLDEINYWIDLLQQDLEVFAQSDDKSQVLRCFSRKPDYCTSFNCVCPYFSVCAMCANPLKLRDSNPLNMEIAYWNPLEKEVKMDFEELKKEGEKHGRTT